MELQPFLFGLHSGLRWIVVAISVVAALYFLLRALGTVGGGPDRLVMMAFTIGMDVQILVGLLLITAYILNGVFQTYQIGHLVLMLLALGLTHVAARWKNAAPTIRARNNLFTILAVLVLVFVGVIALQGGLARWGIST